MKTIIGLAIVYLILVGGLYVTNVCPEYIDRMPKIIEDGYEPSFKEIVKSKIQNKFFCPFSEYVY